MAIFSWRSPLQIFYNLKKVLAIGPGESAIELSKQGLDTSSFDIVLGMHRVFPHLNVDLDFWTWADPDASIEGLTAILDMNPGNFENIPNIILPWYLDSIENFKQNCGSSPILKASNKIKDLYTNTIKILNESKKITWINNAINTKTISPASEIFSNPNLRFNSGITYFGSVPYDSVQSESNWSTENKFTSFILPICHYIGATHVYSLGFDNKGLGIKRKTPQSNNNPKTIKKYLSKYPLWLDKWKDIHNINIYSITPDKYTPNNSIMEYINIDNV